MPHKSQTKAINLGCRLSIVAWLLLGFFVIGAIVQIVGSIVNNVAGVGKSTWASIYDTLGRKGLGCRAFVPLGLGVDEDPLLPQTDTDRHSLAAYRPGENTPLVRPRRKFEPTLEPKTVCHAEVAKRIDILKVPEILAMPTDLPYARLVEVPPHRPYPVPRPERPQPAVDVPTWTSWPTGTPWGPSDEPSFAPPLWEGRLSFLNRFVYKAYGEEFKKVQDATRRKAQLIEQCEWRNREVAQLAQKAEMTRQEFVAQREREFADATAQWALDATSWEQATEEDRKRAEERSARIKTVGPDGLLARIDLALRVISWPSFVSTEGETRFDLESGVLIHEHRFPDPTGLSWVKVTQLKAGPTLRPANKTESKNAAARLHPSLCLRLVCEIVRLDYEGIVKAVAINGWADYTEKSTGQTKRAYCASLYATREQIAALNLRSLDPLAAFSALKGICARSMELTPIAPVIRLDTNDPRFVDPKETLSGMTEGENLASMAWEDFEHLCRELFEKAFAGSGAEVKITQASRDKGVDAIAFDPDPIRGGKIVIQAKRYTNTVDVAAVRDLYGTVINEGATKGILVTTSHFGVEAYSFAKDKPLTLLNGNELLGLLESHGYTFRIDLAEAKRRL